MLSTIKLYKIEDEDVSTVSEAPLKQDMLETDVCTNKEHIKKHLNFLILRMPSLSMLELQDFMSGLGRFVYLIASNMLYFHS